MLQLKIEVWQVFLQWVLIFDPHRYLNLTDVVESFNLQPPHINKESTISLFLKIETNYIFSYPVVRLEITHYKLLLLLVSIYMTLPISLIMAFILSPSVISPPNHVSPPPRLSKNTEASILHLSFNHFDYFSILTNLLHANKITWWSSMWELYPVSSWRFFST